MTAFNHLGGKSQPRLNSYPEDFNNGNFCILTMFENKLFYLFLNLHRLRLVVFFCLLFPFVFIDNLWNGLRVLVYKYSLMSSITSIKWSVVSVVYRFSLYIRWSLPTPRLLETWNCSSFIWNLRCPLPCLQSSQNFMLFKLSNCCKNT